MKKIFRCEVCGEEYSSEHLAVGCEERHAVELAKRKESIRLRQEREDTINELINEYIEQYGLFPTLSISGENYELLSEHIADNISDFFRY